MTERENMELIFQHKMPEYIPHLDTHAYGLYDTYVERPINTTGYDVWGCHWISCPESLNITHPDTADIKFEDMDNWRDHVQIPDLDSIDLSPMKKEADEFPDRENKMVQYVSLNGIFERSHILMGFENALCACMDDPEEFGEMLKAFADHKIRLIQKVYDLCQPDILTYHDDMATQAAQFLPTDFYVEYLFPQYKRIVDAAREIGYQHVVHHSCGRVGGRVCANMLEEVPAEDLTFTCPDLSRLSKEKKEKYEKAGVTIKQANYDNLEEMTEAFKGGDRIYVVSSILNGPERVVQHKNVFDACVAAGVGHIVYTSFFGANRPDYHQYVLPDHTATEAYLKEMSSRLGFTYNVMRNNLYMENYLTNSVMLANLSDYVWGTNAGEGRFTPIAKDDSGACASALLLGKGGYNTDYDLTSQTPICEREMCEMVAEHSGKPYRFVAMNDEEYLAYLDNLGISRGTEGYNSKAPVLWCSNDMVTNEGGIAGGQMGVASNDVEKLLGRKPLEVADIIDKYSYMWEENVTNWKQIR